MKAKMGKHEQAMQRIGGLFLERREALRVTGSSICRAYGKKPGWAGRIERGHFETAYQFLQLAKSLSVSGEKLWELVEVDVNVVRKSRTKVSTSHLKIQELEAQVAEMREKLDRIIEGSTGHGK